MVLFLLAIIVRLTAPDLGCIEIERVDFLRADVTHEEKVCRVLIFKSSTSLVEFLLDQTQTCGWR
jgi:hypothetical protein